jgi:very-short-patch-repair endonuclease
MAMYEEHGPPPPAAAIGATAATQHGLLSVDQQRLLGVSKKAVESRRLNGRYERIGRGVDRISGAPLTWEQQVMAACLIAGPLVAASHRTASRLWNLGTFEAPIEISTRYERSPDVDGVVRHRSLDLDCDDITIVRDIPTTTVTRLLVDAGAVLPRFLVGRLVERAVGRKLTNPDELAGIVRRVGRRGRRGAGVLRQVLNGRALGARSGESELEEIFARLCAEWNLPAPSFQHWIDVRGEWRRIDFAYVEKKIAIEIDGYEFHSPNDIFVDDRVRQNDLVGMQWRVLRFTYEQLVRHPETVVRQILDLF